MNNFFNCRIRLILVIPANSAIFLCGWIIEVSLKSSHLNNPANLSSPRVAGIARVHCIHVNLQQFSKMDQPKFIHVH